MIAARCDALTVARRAVELVRGAVDGERLAGCGERAGQARRREDDERGCDHRECANLARPEDRGAALGAATERECGAPEDAAKSGEKAAGCLMRIPDAGRDKGELLHGCPAAERVEGPAPTDARGKKASADAARHRGNCEEDSTARWQQGREDEEHPHDQRSMGALPAHRCSMRFPLDDERCARSTFAQVPQRSQDLPALPQLCSTRRMRPADYRGSNAR
jgi:hypothetical protein